SYGNVQLETDIPQSDEQGWGAYQPFLDGTRVYITKPDGTREGYTFEPQVAQTFFSLSYYVPIFVPDPGVTDTLSVPDELLLKDALTGQYYIVDSFLETYNPADPVFGNTYTLKQFNGTSETFNATTGQLMQAASRQGNTLNFTDHGITSSTDKTVLIQRDQ